MDSCAVCHTSIPAVNPYGADYGSHGHSFAAIELLDSDSDGYTNLQEIEALTFPGDAGSHPVVQPTGNFTAAHGYNASKRHAHGYITTAYGYSHNRARLHTNRYAHTTRRHADCH